LSVNTAPYSIQENPKARTMARTIFFVRVTALFL
jgi:hypothetical protein